jgi:hypothetical protein
VLAQLFHVLHQVPGGVVFEAGVRLAPAATALIEQNDSVCVWIEETAGAVVATGAGSAVHEHGRLAFGIAALFVVDLVHVRDAQHAALIRLDGWIQRPQAAGGFGRALAFGEDGVAGVIALFAGRGRAGGTTGRFTLLGSHSCSNKFFQIGHPATTLVRAAKRCVVRQWPACL